MEAKFPESDEPVILTTPKIIISGIPHVAVLTEKRILLVKNDPQRIHEEISLAAVRMGAAGENSFREPTITLTFEGTDGKARSIELVFVHNYGSLNDQDRDKFLTKLRAQNVPVSMLRDESGEISSVTAGGSPAGPGTGIDPGRRTAQEWMPSRKNEAPKKPAPVIISERSPLFTIGVIIVIIIAVVGMAMFATQFVKGVPGPAGKAAEPAISQVPTASMTVPEPIVTTETPAETITPGPASQTMAIIPTTGVFVRVDYPGKYIGYVGAKGRFTQVNATGERLFQVAEVSGMIEGSIEKQDGSSDPLSVTVYKDGILLSATNTTIPFGIADIHVPL